MARDCPDCWEHERTIGMIGGAKNVATLYRSHQALLAERAVIAALLEVGLTSMELDLETFPTIVRPNVMDSQVIKVLELLSKEPKHVG